jgi:TyrR family helix-turn-helix protein
MDITEIISLRNKVKDMEKIIKEYNYQLEQMRKQTNRIGNLTFKSEKMKNIIQLLERVAHLDNNILLLGESGVGKTALANWTHQISHRKKGPFIEVNCGAIPASLFESELFGYESGAFSGALSTGKIGLLESANRGTIFLDEIAEIPLDLQTKLLQVIQSKSFIRVGGRQTTSVDIRIMAATNKNLKKMVSEGKFREDLYFRLNVFPIHIPPLRERTEDLLILIQEILSNVNHKYGFQKVFSSEVIKILLNRQWKGNIRELENTIERMVLYSNDDLISSDILTNELNRNNSKEDEIDSDALASTFTDGVNFNELVGQYEKKILEHYVYKLGSTRKIAGKLGISPTTISRKCKKYHIPLLQK